MKYDLEERLIEFSIEIIELSEKIPKTYVGIHLAKQIVRSGLSPAFQYAEATSAESRKDFIHKMKIGLKELRETFVCLKIIKRKPLVGESELEIVLKECNELIAIFNTSIRTARNNLNTKKS
ncbi:MAG: four helix bundle protein [Balneola sp.]